MKRAAILLLAPPKLADEAVRCAFAAAKRSHSRIVAIIPGSEDPDAAFEEAARRKRLGIFDSLIIVGGPADPYSRRELSSLKRRSRPVTRFRKAKRRVATAQPGLALPSPSAADTSARGPASGRACRGTVAPPAFQKDEA